MHLSLKDARLCSNARAPRSTMSERPREMNLQRISRQ